MGGRKRETVNKYRFLCKIMEVFWNLMVMVMVVVVTQLCEYTKTTEL